MHRQCCQLIRLLGRVPTLGPEQLRQAISLAIAGTVGYFGRSTPMPFAVCASIEAVRAETLRQRGICEGEPRILAFAPYAAGGLELELTYQYAASAFIDTFDWVLCGDAGAPSRQALASHIALSCWRLGCRTHPLKWNPTHIPETGGDGLRDDLLVEAWLLYRRHLGAGAHVTAALADTALAQEYWEGRCRWPKYGGRKLRLRGAAALE